MFFTGVGIGVAMPVMNLAVQNEFSQQELGTVTAASQLFRNLGSTLGTAIFGGMLTAGIVANLGNIQKIPYIEQLTKQPQASKYLGTVDADTALNLNTVDQKDKINKAVNKALPKIANAKLANSPASPAVKQQLKNKIVHEAKSEFNKKQKSFSHRIVYAMSDSLRNIFYGSAGLMFVGFVVSWFVTEKRLRSSHDAAPGVE